MIPLKFKNLISKGNVNGGLKLLVGNMYNGNLLFTKDSLELLVQKYPEPREPSPDILIPEPTTTIHPVA